jgi:hypothetical protein
MSNETTGQEQAVNVTTAVTAAPAPGTARRARKRVNLATAHVADGQAKAPTSVYEMLGISTHGYKTTSLAAYSADLKGMNRYQLHEEAYARAVLATDNREILIDRLEKKFIVETSKFKTANGPSDRKFEEVVKKEESIRDQASRILARGR